MKNGIDKLVTKGLRNKYLESPTTRDIKIDIRNLNDEDYCYIAFEIGNNYRRYINFYRDEEKILIKKKRAEITMLSISFNKTYNIEDLKKLGTIIPGFNYQSLFNPSLKKGILNDEGLQFVKELQQTLKRIHNRFLNINADIKGIKGEINVFSPCIQSLFKETNNKHMFDIEWEIRNLQHLIDYNEKRKRGHL